jgi:hypothetical protein
MSRRQSENEKRASLSERPVNARSKKRRGIAAILLFVGLAVAGCSGLTGWRIPGTEVSALPTIKAYLVLENVDTLPENLQSEGEIYVDDAFFGHTSRPAFNKFVGNELVVGSMQIEKEKMHTIRVEYPGYEPFEHTRYFGALSEYSISFRLKRLEAGPAVAWETETEAEPPRKKRWFEFWKTSGE